MKRPIIFLFFIFLASAILAAEKEEKAETPFEYNLRWYRNDFKWWSIWHEEFKGNLGKENSKDKFNITQVLNSIERLKKWVRQEKAGLFEPYLDLYLKIKDRVEAGQLTKPEIKVLQNELKGIEKQVKARFHYKNIKPAEWIREELVDKSVWEKVESGLVVAESVQKSGYRYTAHRYGRVFHKLNCETARQIKESDRFYYKTKRKAFSTGRKACRSCKP